MLNKQTFYKYLHKEKYTNKSARFKDISERIPTKDNKYDIYFYFRGNYKRPDLKPYAEYRIYKHYSEEYVQETKIIDVLGLNLDTEYKFYKYLRNEVNKFYFLKSYYCNDWKYDKKGNIVGLKDIKMANWEITKENK